MKRIKTNLFDITTVKREGFGGALLVAGPFLEESYFNQGVVSLVSYSQEDGAMGMVLNNLTGYRMPDILPGQVDRTPETESIPVFLGGPVSDDRLFYIHNLGPDIISDCDEYFPGLYAGGSFRDVLNYVNSGYPVDGRIRFFIGYSGWSAGQLEEELLNEVWAVADMHGDTSEVLRGADDPYWHSVVRTMGESYRNWLYHPQNVQCN